MTLNKIIEAYPEIQFSTADGFNEAVIGIDLDSARLIYSVGKCIDILVYTDGMDIEDAIKYFEENVRESYTGEDAPIWANTDF
jgi:hypothetical protein